MSKSKLGIQILLNLFNCSAELLNDVEQLKIILNEITIESNLTKVGESFHQFAPGGATGVILLSESHICIHTWPEYNTAAIDIFSCSSEENAKLAARLLIEKFNPEKYDEKIIYR